MNWTPLNTKEQLEQIKIAVGYALIFKHSTRCSISMMAKKRLEQDWDELPENTSLYFLDLLSYRDLSSHITGDFLVNHESPQFLLIKDGECILSQSHSNINLEEITEMLQEH